MSNNKFNLQSIMGKVYQKIDTEGQFLLQEGPPINGSCRLLVICALSFYLTLEIWILQFFSLLFLNSLFGSGLSILGNLKKPLNIVLHISSIIYIY